uniref:Reticulon 4 receptor like 2 n=1 Tax=Catharus ustulatus TaxID=91951 RepID=A0A8C3UQC9_CATUS
MTGWARPRGALWAAVAGGLRGAGGRPAALLLLAALVWVPGGAPACPALCTCYVSPPTVSCQANNFSSVPAGLPPGARRLFLQNNVIGALRAGTFGPSTVTLWLYSNNISSIQPGTFRHLPALEELDLGDNPHLRVLGVFRGLSSLDRLLLHANRLAAIHRRAFGGLARLTILYLFNNSLVALPGDPLAALPSLQFLRLNANPWACDCRARPLWAWFRRTRVSSSPVPCASPPHRRGTDLRHLRPRDFDACPEDDDDEGEEMEDGNGGGGNGVAVMGTPGCPHDPCAPMATAVPHRPPVLLPLLALILPRL